jgi:hypothetical protein
MLPHADLITLAIAATRRANSEPPERQRTRYRCRTTDRSFEVYDPIIGTIFEVIAGLHNQTIYHVTTVTHADLMHGSNFKLIRGPQ